MGETQRLLRNTALIAIGNFGAKAVSFLLLPLYTSVLATEEYGSYDLIVTISAFLMPIVLVGMQESMFRYLIDRGNDEGEFRVIVSSTFLVVGGALLVLGAVVMVLYAVTSIDYLPVLYAYILAGCLYTLSNNLLRGMGEISAYAAVSSAKNVLQVILNVVAVLVLRFGANGLIASLFLSELLAFVFVVVWKRLWRQVDLRRATSVCVREMLAYSLPLVPNAICAQIISLSDRLIITYELGASANGIYSVSYKFPDAVETVYHYFYTAWSESASRVIKLGQEEARSYYKRLLGLVDSATYSVILLMTAGMSALFSVFVRGDYVLSFEYIPLLMIAVYFNCLGMFYAGIFAAYKDTGVMAVSTVSSAILNVVLNLLLIPRLGLRGAASATLASQLLLYLMRAASLRRHVSLGVDVYRWCAKGASLVCVLAFYSYDNANKIAVAIIVAILSSVILNRDAIATLIGRRGRDAG